MQEFFSQISHVLGSYVPNLLGAMAILVIGWIVALAVSALTRGLVRRAALGKNLASFLNTDDEHPVLVEHYFAKAIFYIIMLFVLIAFFQVLGLTVITEPLNNMLNQLFVYAPRFFGAILLFAIAWGLATVLRFLVAKLLASVNLDERLSGKMEEGQSIELGSTIAHAVYWLIFLLFLPAILGSLQMQGLLEPVQSMMEKALTFLPNIFTAALILFIGWIMARIIRTVVSNALAIAGLNKLGDNIGLGSILGKEKLSNLIGLIVYVLILIVTLLIALETLMLDALTAPISNMLNVVLEALPRVFAAILIVFIAFVMAKLVARLVANLLSGVGFDRLLGNLGVLRVTEEDENRAANAVGQIALFAILFLATIEAFEVMGFYILPEIAEKLVLFAGNVLLGLIVFGVGLFIANIVSNKILAGETARHRMISLLSRVAILFLAGAMALKQMGIGGEIVNLAFGLILGAIAVAIAVAFGLGGRDMAASALKTWKDNLDGKH